MCLSKNVEKAIFKRKNRERAFSCFRLLPRFLYLFDLCFKFKTHRLFQTWLKHVEKANNMCTWVSHAWHFQPLHKILINVFIPWTNETRNKFNRNKKMQLSNSLDILQFTGEGKLPLLITCFFFCCCCCSRD